MAEDVESLGVLMKRWLEAEGYVVEIAEDGRACAQKVASFKPDLAVLDIMLPKVHGIEIIKVLARTSHKPKQGARTFSYNWFDEN